MEKYLRKNNKGFTLIEMMISVAIFIAVVVAGMGALLSASAVSQKAQNMRSIMDNLSFIMEDMARNLRTGYNYYCITGATIPSAVNIPKSGSSCWGIAFEPTDGNPASNPADQWVYYIDNTGKLWKATQGPYNTISNFVQLTPNNVVLNTTTSGFSVLGAEPPSSGDKQQPFATIRLVGTINYENTVTPFSVQTSISQRLLDI